MSALTSSPSPAGSPRPYTRSPRPTSSYATSAHRTNPALTDPHRLSASSPRRAFNAPIASPTAPQPKLNPPTVSADVETAPVANLAGYVDAGTQYSPDGFPPTAGSKVALGTGQPPGAVVRTRKRKDVVSSSSSASDSSHEPMSGTSASSGAPKNAPGISNQRDNPAHQSASASGILPSAPELKEARSTHGHSAAPKKARPEPGSLKVMPLKYETCNPKDLGVLIANMLMELIRINDQIPLRDGRLTRFHSRAPPGISVSDYLQRLIQHATLSPPIMLSMVYYIDKLCTEYPAFTVNSLTVHRFLIAAATVAAKGLSDSFWTNPTYARIGGIPVTELATLELELLQRVDYKIVPKPEVLEEYYASLVERAEGYILEESGGSGSDSSSLSSNELDASKRAESIKSKQDEDTTMTDGPT
ncbi:unnamed protein product [Zymoseptoria tritici ST99CH_3D1]|nr:unnamed protein product [Zymoseptoria tritici ST99CH_3D1]